MRTIPVTLKDPETGDDTETVVQLPGYNVVCSRCDGEGKSSAHLGSFTREDFDEDPDFAEDYMEGKYDIPCEKCKGRCVTFEIDRDANMTDEQKAALKQLDDEAQYKWESFQERKNESLMGGGSTLRDWDGVYPG